MLLIHSAFINLWILWLNWPSSSILFWILFSCNAKFNFVMIYYNNLLLMAGPWKGNYRCYSSSPQESCCNLRWRRHNEVVETLIFFLLYFYVMIINENLCVIWVMYILEQNLMHCWEIVVYYFNCRSLTTQLMQGSEKQHQDCSS
jgi:hypothetical protein